MPNAKDIFDSAPDASALFNAAPEVPGKLEAFQRGATKGALDRVLARAQAMQEQQGAPRDAFQSFDVVMDKPVDPDRMEADRARILAERRAKGAAAEEAHPVMHTMGAMVPAVASMAVPGGATVKGAAAIGGGLGLLGSESDSAAGAAGDTALSAAMAGGWTKLLNAAGRALLPRATALRNRLATQLGDKAAKDAEAIARSAGGTAGAARANASRTIELLGRDAALPAREVAENQAALATPEAEQLASQLASKARAELPEKLAHVQSTETLAAQAAGDAASARGFGETTDYATQMLAQRAKDQVRRYAIPAAIGAGTGYLMGDKDHGTRGLGALGGLVTGAAGGRQFNAVVRNLILSPEARRLAAEGTVSAVQDALPAARDVATRLAPSEVSALRAYLDALRKPKNQKPNAAQIFEAAQEEQ